MLFNTPGFMLFLLAVLALYAVATTHAQRAVILLAASFIFYAAWKPAYVLLLMASLSVNYLFYTALTRKRSKTLLIAAVTLNLCVLAVCKYIVFLTDNFILAWTALSGSGASVPDWMHWVLPLGISFYTFHMLSVMIDVYRGEWTHRISFRTWTLYVTFFPHMVAGPILRASELVQQLETLAPLRRTDLQLGAFLFLGGLLKKLLLADHLGPIANEVYARPADLDAASAWLGTVAFSLQIYFDFSGYSEMAIGLARMFGVTLPRNFLYPYISRNPREFWQRWHITLSRWLRDYLYVSLGGSRVGFARNQVNLLTTMLLGGLWHGAAWTFVIWGSIHGLWLVAHRVLLQLFDGLGVDRRPALARALGFGGWPVTMGIVAFTWVFFRATSVEAAFEICAAMLGLSGTTAPGVDLRSLEKTLIGCGALVALAEPLFVNWCTARDVCARWSTLNPLLQGCAYAALVLLLIVFGGSPQKFIYFDF
jgi:alginate O-acetyltransferase complex protein AlgI